MIIRMPSRKGITPIYKDNEIQKNALKRDSKYSDLFRRD
jgi:hypothetical protein